MRTLWFIPALALVILLLAGCGTQASAAAEPVKTAEVRMPPSYQFEPAAIQVPVGTAVTWRNSDHFTHSVSVVDADFPFLNLPPGESGTITFDKPGAYAYICTYHAQDMKGTVIVNPR